LGLDPIRTQQALALPPEITLSFPVTQVANLQGWINQARARGHEVMLELPMEPRTYPNDDPGPDTLLANARPDETLQKLDGLLARASGYFGVTNYQGSKFLTSNAAMDALATGLRRRGLAFVDDGLAGQRGGGIPRASADRVIDVQPGRDAISAQLSQLEQTAQSRGSALGSGFGYSLTIQQVAAWAQGLAARGYQLAPASAVTVRR
ncbi:MAG: divergent polysaccharide deacetylase family protein, partial [Alphaproteobacteria bacterium]